MKRIEFLNSVQLEGEEWKFLQRCSSDYAVSSFGRVASFKMKSPRLLTIVFQESKGKTYSHVCINSKKVRVHRLVAELFVPNPKGYNEVDHINNNPRDNRAENLRWCTHAENMNNPLTREVQQKYLPLKNNTGTAIFFNKHEDTMKAVVQIKDGEVIAKYMSLGEAERSGYKKTSLSAAINGRLKSYRGCKWILLSDYEALAKKKV